MEEKQPTRDVYAIVTNRIMDHLKSGFIPWKQPWTKSGAPQNLITKKPYRGINIMLLASLHYQRNYFLSFKQIKELGAELKKEERPHIVVFWKWEEKEDKDGKKKNVPFLRYYSVFNVDQCTGIPEDKIPVVGKINKPILKCKELINVMPQCPEIRHKQNRAFYHTIEDYVNMPEMKLFDNSASYYSVLFHELVHSTGHAKRLNRKEISDIQNMVPESYSIEELTAEIGACYLNSIAGIEGEGLKNSVAYIQGWLNRLSNDKKFILYASTQAQKASDYILNIPTWEKYEEAEEQTTMEKAAL